MRTTLKRADWSILLALLLFSLFFRLATLMTMNTGVDERDYWYSAKALTQGLQYPELSHRTTRFAVILPVALAQLIFGVHPNVYYVMPVLNSLVQAALAFAIGLRLRGRLTGFLAGIFLVLFPYMIKAGSQVRPEIFSITYILAALYFFIEYAQRSTNELPPLLWTAGMLFIAYEAKLTNLFFVPGMVLGVLLYKRKLPHVFLFCGFLLLLFLLETAAYALFTEFKLGELEIISKTHFSEGSPFTVPHIVDLLQRYLPPYLQAYWLVFFGVFAVLSVYYLAKGAESRVSLLAISALSFLVGITFEVESFIPIVPAEPFINRYFSAVLGPVFLVVAFATEGFFTRFFPRVHRIFSGGSARAYALVLASGVVVILGLFSLPGLPSGLREYANSPFTLRQHPLVLNEKYRREVNMAYSEGTPIVAAEDLVGENAILTCEFFFMEGKPPAHLRIQRGNSGYLVLSRNVDRVLTDNLLAVVRSPFRVASIQASDLPRLTGDSFNGESETAKGDPNE